MSANFQPKRIHVFLNGNPTGRIFFIHPKCKVSWSSIINFIGDLLKPSNGPIRTLRTEKGYALTSYEELEENGKYIACGKEPLIPLLGGYRTDSETELQKDLKEFSSSEILNAIKRDQFTDNSQLRLITIYVFINGHKNKPNRICLLKNDLQNWSIILNIISKQLNCNVKYLYTIFGEKIVEPTEIQHRGFYVALTENCKFDDISYLSVFSMKRQRKVRFKQTTQQTLPPESKINAVPPNEIDLEEKDEMTESIDSSSVDRPFLIESPEVGNFNGLTSESSCIHVKIAQEPSIYDSEITPKEYATKSRTKLVFEILGEYEQETKCIACKSTQTNSIFCSALPRGKCLLEIGSKKFRIINDDETIVLPCGTYFSSHRAMKQPCAFPMNGQSFSLEEIANHIIGIVVDGSEFCSTRSIDNTLDQILQEKETKTEQNQVEETNNLIREVLQNESIIT